MRLFITGATGLIGRRLVLDRLARGDRVTALSRDGARAASLFAADVNPNVTVVNGDPSAPGIWQERVDGCDAVVHLAGAGVGDRRWTNEYKRLIVNSRLDSTHQVVEAIEQATQRPKILISSSAVGWYGDTGDRETDEQAEPLRGDFFGDLCLRWENEAARAEAAGARVVALRTGVVLDPRGGIVGRMARPFRMFLGGQLGRGRQYVPWIHWRDLVGLIDLALCDDSLRGPLNGTAPRPVTNRDFSRAFGRALSRPSWLPVPRLALRVVLGEFARYALMSQRIVPARAISAGYRFVHPEIDAALEAVFAQGPDGREPANGRSANGPGGNRPGTNGNAGRRAGRPQTPIRLLAVGVDGPTPGDDARLPPGLEQACRAARRAGVVVVPASARSPRGLRPVLEALAHEGPTINFDGALIWNPLDDRAQYHETLDGALALEIVRAAREAEPDVLVAIEDLDHWFTDRVDPSGTAPFGAAGEPDAIGPIEQFLVEPVTRVSLFGTPAQIATVREVIDERYWRSERIARFHSDPTLLQVTHRLVDKSIALQRIAQRIGATGDAVVAVGRGPGDMGMLEWAGFGVAIGSAVAGLGTLADVVVSAADDDGILRAIERRIPMQS